MPFKIRKLSKKKYSVYNADTGVVYSKGTTKKKALGQLSILNRAYSKTKKNKGGRKINSEIQSIEPFERSARIHRDDVLHDHVDLTPQQIKIVLTQLRRHYDTHSPALISYNINHDDLDIADEMLNIIFKALGSDLNMVRQYIPPHVNEDDFFRVFRWIAGLEEFNNINKPSFSRLLNEPDLWRRIMRYTGLTVNPSVDLIITLTRNIGAAMIAANQLEEMINEDHQDSDRYSQNSSNDNSFVTASENGYETVDEEERRGGRVFNKTKKYKKSKKPLKRR